ncbi:CST complex subunit Ten1 [Xylaria sp. FL0933]|nr:CST complex subunit Ten1 [Xylaria sp. FL0933]
MSNGPLPSKRCLLSALCKKQVGEKHLFNFQYSTFNIIRGLRILYLATIEPELRRLFVVRAYSTHSARVTLRHHCPKENDDVEALVDVNLLLETLKSEQTDAGQWVHVIGYITFVDAGSSRNKSVPRIGVQALVLWIAQDLDLRAYENSMLADADHSTGSLASGNSYGK